MKIPSGRFCITYLVIILISTIILTPILPVSLSKTTVEQWDITHLDKYHGKIGSWHYNNFLQQLKTAEQQLARDYQTQGHPGQYNLLHILFMLLQNNGMISLKDHPFLVGTLKFISTLDDLVNNWVVEKWVDKELRDLITQIHTMLTNYQQILTQRDYNSLADTNHTPGKDEFQRGSLPYLLVTAHSVSVQAYIRKLLTLFASK